MKSSDFICMTWRGTPINELSKEEMLKALEWSLPIAFEVNSRVEFTPTIDPLLQAIRSNDWDDDEN